MPWGDRLTNERGRTGGAKSTCPVAPQEIHLLAGLACCRPRLLLMRDLNERRMGSAWQ